jgi:hypothetical protein
VEAARATFVLMNPKQECERLLDSVFPVAELLLKKQGTFYPFGGYMEPNGEITHVGAKDSDTDYPMSEDLIDLLRSSFREMAGTRKCKASALIIDVRVTPAGSNQKTDAIQACLDHVDGYSVEVFFPYRIVDGEVVFGETYACQGKYEIFGKPAIQ